MGLFMLYEGQVMHNALFSLVLADHALAKVHSAFSIPLFGFSWCGTLRDHLILEHVL